MSPHRGPTAFVKFRADAPFSFHISATEARHRQGGDGSRAYYTRSRLVLQQVRQAGPAARVVAESAHFRTLPAERWARDYGRQKVMFVLPSEALGDCVGVVLFLRAFRRRFPEAGVTIANTGGASDLFGREPGVRVLPLVVSEKELDGHFPIIDLGEVDGWDTVTTQPVDVETTLLLRFGLEPVEVPPRPLSAGRPAVAILPMASSPLRTLPPQVAAAAATTLCEKADVTVVLNAYQGLKPAYERRLVPLLPKDVRVSPGFPTTAGLLDFLAAQDFVVTADSGPAHLSKLFGTRGLAVYTSASGTVLQGRHGNLGLWQVEYAGRHCAAPCGLAKLRATADGRVGCMGSLNLPVEDLPNLVGETQPALAERLTLDEFVPCVARLVEERDSVAQAAMGRLLALSSR